MRRVLRSLVADDKGQDLIEYALLAVLVALLTIPALNAIQAALNVTYQGWNTAMQRCWQMPEPGHGGGC
jgi:Flp pilus assembly pilin Flp